VKYASSFYGPFREAADCAPKFGDRAATRWTGERARALREALVEAARPRASFVSAAPKRRTREPAFLAFRVAAAAFTGSCETPGWSPPGGLSTAR